MQKERITAESKNDTPDVSLRHFCKVLSIDEFDINQYHPNRRG